MGFVLPLDPSARLTAVALLFQANLFVLLSIICVLLSVASFIVVCQGIKFASGVPQCDVVSMTIYTYFFALCLVSLPCWDHKKCQCRDASDVATVGWVEG